METFIVAYLLVWLGVVAFIARMGIRMRRLNQAIEDLNAQRESESVDGAPQFNESKAA